MATLLHRLINAKRPLDLCDDDPHLGMRPTKRSKIIYMDEGSALSARFPRAMPINRSLILVLDLDHTLLHSSFNAHPELYVQEKHNLIFAWDSVGLVTKLRPFAREFIRKVSEMYDLCVYTNGSRIYGRQMAKLLDPEGVYIRNRIISREDSTVAGKKSLDVIAGHPSNIVVLDDTLLIWDADHRDNVVHTRKYYFSGFRDVDIPERDDDLEMIYYGVLERIYKSHYYEDCRDVRLLLKAMRKEVLRGCCIAFAGRFEFPEVLKAEGQGTWEEAAEGMGATWKEHMAGGGVTHVVIGEETEAKDMEWALDHGKNVVGVTWLEAAYYGWKRPREIDFSPLLDVVC